jgi:hypothetical protein
MDIFRFWGSPGIKGLKDGKEYVHPADRDVLGRIKHTFDLRCLPSCFSGPLRTAPVVLLYLNPGLSKQDRRDPQTRKGREYYRRKIKGYEPLCSEDHHAVAWKWWTGRTKIFSEESDELRDKVAILEIGAYHSKRLANTSVLAALPSSRVMLDWAQTKLFQEAVDGRRIVICLRAARFWGLDAGVSGRRYGKSLYVPIVTRGGHLEKRRMRKEIIAAVRDIISG